MKQIDHDPPPQNRFWLLFEIALGILLVYLFHDPIFNFFRSLLG